MQQSTHNLGHAKHRQAFGKTNRNPTNNLILAREKNRESDERQEQKDRQKPPMFGSVAEAMKARKRKR